jgi:hypothetical protein
MGTNIHRNVLWSDSLTKEYLTSYAEGLACVNFDKRLHYNVRRQDDKSWYVMRKSTTINSDCVTSENSNKSIRFDRVRRVYIDPEGYMTCTCGYVQRHLMPCVHICAVVDKREYYVPSMFHVRWYKCFNYYYDQKFALDIAPATLSAVTQLLDHTRATHYHEHSGIYKGVYMNDSPFCINLDTFKSPNVSETINDPVLNEMKFIVQHTLTQGPVIQGTYLWNYNTVASSNNIDDEISENSYFDHDYNSGTVEDDPTCSGIVSSSQAEVSLSQARQDICDKPVSEVNPVMSFAYRDVLPCFEEWFNSCRSVDQYNRLRQIMSEEHYKNIAENNKNKESVSNSNIFIGSQPTNSKRTKRKKFKHERY